MTNSNPTGAFDIDALFEHASTGLIAPPPAAAEPPRPAAAAVSPSPEAVAPSDVTLHQRLGQMTRMLHEALRELGYDRKIADAARSLPDARDRLGYIATLSGQSADKVLSAVERGQAARESLAEDVHALAARLDPAATAGFGTQDWKALAADARAALMAIGERSDALGGELHAIMMAQDFHDLTGQVIKRVADLACTLEGSLVDLLLESHAAEARGAEPSLSGPQIRPGGADVVANQAQVDDLLESLGF